MDKVQAARKIYLCLLANLKIKKQYIISLKHKI